MCRIVERKISQKDGSQGSDWARPGVQGTHPGVRRKVLLGPPGLGVFVQERNRFHRERQTLQLRIPEGG